MKREGDLALGAVLGAHEERQGDISLQPHLLLNLGLANLHEAVPAQIQTLPPAAGVDRSGPGRAYPPDASADASDHAVALCGVARDAGGGMSSRAVVDGGSMEDR